MSNQKESPKLSPQEYRLMATLAWPRTGSEVEELYFQRFGTRISFGSLYGTLKRLRHDGFVKSVTSKEDRRFKVFKITGSGRRAFSSAHKFYEDSHRAAELAQKELERPTGSPAFGTT